MSGGTRAGRRSPRRLRNAATGALAVVMTVACAAAGPSPREPEAAAPGPPSSALVAEGSRYVALGSSFASGPGLRPVSDEECLRSAENYAAQVGAALRLAVTDVSCAATTTDNILTKPHVTGEGERPPQIEAITPDTQLVTVTIGGNDVGYATLLDDYGCLDTRTCEGIVVDEDAVRSALATVTGRLVATIDSIRQQAPQAVVLLMTYPQIVPSSGETCSAIALSPEHARFVGEVAAQLQEAFLTAGRETGVRVVDAYTASEGHSACAPVEPWVSGWVPDSNPDGIRAFHPTPGGMRGVADLVLQTVTSS